MIVFDEKQKEMQDQKKKLLQEKFLNKVKSKKSVSPEIDKPPTTDWENKYRLEKQKRKSAETQLKGMDKRLSTAQNEILDLKMKSKKEKENAFEFQVELKEVQNILKKTEAELLKTIEANKVLLKSHKVLDDRIQKLKVSDSNKIKSTNVKLTNKNRALANEVKNLQNKLMTADSISNMEKNRNHNELITNLNRKNLEYKKRLRQFHDKMTPDFLLELLNEAVTEENLHYFFKNSTNKITQIAGNANVLKREMAKKKKTEETKATPASKTEDLSLSPEAKHSMSNIRIGYLTKRENGWFFVDIYKKQTEEEAAVYEIIEVDSNLQFIIDQPVKVKIKKNKAVVLKTYEELPLDEIQKNNEYQVVSKEKKETDNAKYPHFGSYKVLLIGSSRLNRYKDRLQKHGLEVDIHNPFEEHESRIKNKAARADVVIVCTSHTSHSVLDHVEAGDKRVELIENDTEETIFARTRYALVNLGLISGPNQI